MNGSKIGKLREMKKTKCWPVRLLTGLVLVMSAQLALLQEEKHEATEDEPESQVKWTYTPELEKLRDQWIKQNSPKIPSSSLPSEILEEFGIEPTGTIGPEVFFSNEVQDMLVDLHLKGESLPEAQILPFSEEYTADQDSFINELLDLPPGQEGFVELQERMAKHLGLESKEDLPEEVLFQLKQLQLGIEFVNDEITSSDLNDAKSYQSRSVGESSGTLTVELPWEHSEDQATEAFNSLSLKDQERLSEFSEILHDRPALFEAMREMSKKQLIATLNFLETIDSDGTESTRNPLLSLEQESALQQQVDRGYIEQLNRTPPTVQFRKRAEKSITKNELDSFLNNLFGQQIFSLDSKRGMEICSALSPVPSEFLVSDDSNNFVAKSSDLTRRFYSETVFGGSLLIVEQEVDDHGVFQANLTIADHEGMVIPYRYGEGVWTTNLSAFNGKTAFRIYADGKLEGEELQKFIGFARDLVEDGIH